MTPITPEPGDGIETKGPQMLSKQLEQLAAKEKAATPSGWDYQHAETKHPETANMEIVDSDGKRICDTLNADSQEIHHEADGNEHGPWTTYFEDGVRARDMALIVILRNAAPQIIALAEAAQEVQDAFADLPLTGFDTDERYGAEGRLESALEQQSLALTALSAALPSAKEGIA